MTTTTTMMMEINGNDQRLYYLPCNFCTTILAVSVPSCTNQLVNNMVTIRCGRCSNMQTVNMGAMLPAAFLAAATSGAATINPAPLHLQQQQTKCTNSQLPEDYMYSFQAGGITGSGSSSSSSSKLGGGLSKTLISTATASNKHKHPLKVDHDHRANGLMLPNPPPEKRQRAPSAYNRFIKEEIRRIKSCNPDISHKEVFSMAAKNWAHFPHIQFGLALEATKHANLDSSLVGGAPSMAQSYP